MTTSEILPINFTISSLAKRALEQVRRDYDLRFPQDPAAVLSVAWGLGVSDTGQRSENVVIGVYPLSMRSHVASGIQDASGIPMVFFTTEEFHYKFAGKVLDHSGERGFFLREP
jgi:hypothetical protein